VTIRLKQGFLTRLLNLRSSINLIDVGAAESLPSPLREHLDCIGHTLRFEPREQMDTGCKVVSCNMPIWDKNEERDFHIYNSAAGKGSSLFPQNYEYVRRNFEELKLRGNSKNAETWLSRSQLVRTEHLQCRRLDDVLTELAQPFPYHFLKSDTQGAEYQVLKGAEQFLRHECVGLQLELFLIPLYMGITLKPDVEAYLKTLDFELVKTYPVTGTFDSQQDCVFLKRGKHAAIKRTIAEVYEL